MAFKFTSRDQRDAILEWVRSDEVTGRFYVHFRRRENSGLMYFSDPDSAFAFKMRWA